MNYIKHLSAFFEIVADDNSLFPTHISLYMALFQFWNLNRFQNPVSICRKEILQLSKIGSYNTYHKCMHDLHRLGYIKYEPSHNQFIGSLVHLYNFDTSDVQALRQPCRNIDTTSVQALRHSINNINILNNKTYIEEQTQNEFQNLNSKKNGNEITKRKKVAQKKENKIELPTLDEVISFFKSENYPEIEAHKFFNHFESNGWKVGGKTPMKNWKAAARNWILNSQRFSSQNNYQRPHQKPNMIGNKDYSEPL
jgi:hypothetical protein